MSDGNADSTSSTIWPSTSRLTSASLAHSEYSALTISFFWSLFHGTLMARAWWHVSLFWAAHIAHTGFDVNEVNTVPPSLVVSVVREL